MRTIRSALLLLLLAPLSTAQSFVYEQPSVTGGGTRRSSQLWVDPAGQNDLDSDAIAWENFELAQAATITHVRWWGDVAPPLGFDVSFWNQDPNTTAVQPDIFGANSHPIHQDVYTSFTQTDEGNGLFRFELDLSAPVAFAGSTRYFISIVGLTPIPYATWNWAQSHVGTYGTFWWMRGLHMYLHLADERAVSLAGDGGLGTSYCGPAATNSSGLPGVMGATGSKVVADNDLTLVATQLPANQFGYFLVSATQGFVAHPGGSQGNLCLAGQIGRYVNDVANTGATGELSLLIDLTHLPAPLSKPVVAGETWNFQAWFRDKNPNQTSNFSDGLSITFD